MLMSFRTITLLSRNKSSHLTRCLITAGHAPECMSYIPGQGKVMILNYFSRTFKIHVLTNNVFNISKYVVVLLNTTKTPSRVFLACFIYIKSQRNLEYFICKKYFFYNSESAPKSHIK